MKIRSPLIGFIDRVRHQKKEPDNWKNKYLSLFTNWPKPILEICENEIVGYNKAANKIFNLDSPDNKSISMLFGEDFNLDRFVSYPDGLPFKHNATQLFYVAQIISIGDARKYLLELNPQQVLNTAKFYKPQTQELLEALKLHEMLSCCFLRMRDGFYITDLNGNFLTCNESFCELTGYTIEELVKIPLSEITTNNTKQQKTPLLQEVREKTEGQFLDRYRHKDGHSIPVEIQEYNFKKEDKTLGFWYIVHDISEKEKTESKLKESEETYRELFNSSTNAIFLLDPESGKLIDINNTVINLYGYNREEILNIPLSKISENLPPFTQVEIEELFNRVKTEISISYEWHNRRKNGELFWTQNVMKLTSLHGKDFLKISMQDITREKAAHEELLETKLLLETAIEQSPAGIIIAEVPIGKIRYSNLKNNENAPDIIAEIEAGSVPVSEKISYYNSLGEKIEKAELPLMRAIRQGDITNNFELRIVFAEKKDIWLLVNSSPIKDCTGKIIAAILIQYNITERKAAEFELLESKLLLENILDTIPVQVFWKDNNLKYLGCNKLFLNDAELFSIYDIIGKTDYDLIWKDQASKYQRDDRGVIESGIAKLDFEEEFTNSNGETIWYKSNKIPLKNSKGYTLGVLGAYDNITELKNTLLELEKHRNQLETLVKERTHEIERINNELYLKNEELNNINHKLLTEIEDKTSIEEKLKRNEDIFRSFIEQSNEGICLLNDKGIIQEWNNSMSEIYETSNERFLQKPIWEVECEYLPFVQKTNENRIRIENSIRAYISKQEIKPFNNIFEKEVNGKTKYIQYRIFPIQTASGRMFGHINQDISEKRAAEIEIDNYKNRLEILVDNRTNELKQNDTRLQLVLKSVPLAFYSYNPKDKANTLWYSPQVENLSGFKLEDFENNPELWKTRILTNDYEIVGGTFDRLKPNEPLSVEYRWQTAKGELIWIFDQAVLIQETENSSSLIIGCFLDITERKKAEKFIIESEQSHREIYNATSEAIIVLDIESARFIDVNQAMLEMFGYNYSEAIEIDFKSLSQETENSKQLSLLRIVSHTLQYGPQVFEWYARRKDQKPFWTEVSLKSAEIKGSKRVLAVIRDITERKMAQETLRKSEEKYRLLVEGQTDLVVKIDTDGRFLFVSPSYCDLFDKGEQELLGKKFMPLVHKDDQEVTKKAMEKLFKPPNICFVEQRAFTKHGWRWIAWNDKAILDENKRVIEIMGVGRDITYQKTVEEALRRSEDRFRTIVQHLSDIIFVTDEHLTILNDTPPVKKILGYEEGFLIGKSGFDIIHPDDLETVREKLKRLLTKSNHIEIIELRLKNTEGHYVPTETIGINMLTHPSIRGIVITTRDISERKLVEKRILDAIIKAEEMERERFAKNLHDDLGPLLSSIKMYVNSFGNSDDVKKHNFIINQLNEVVKEAIITTKEVSNDLSPHILLNYGLVSAIGSFLKKVPPEIELKFDSTLLSERFSTSIENSIYRIVKELINNTLKHANANHINIILSENGNYLFLSYTDDGIGFDLSQTNKLQPQGMGLSNIMSRAKSLNSVYEIQTSPDNGFNFTIKIPIIQSMD